MLHESASPSRDPDADTLQRLASQGALGAILVATFPAAQSALWRDLNGRPTIARPLDALVSGSAGSPVTLLIPPEHDAAACALARGYTHPPHIIHSPPDWRATLAAALTTLPETCAWVIIHDAARPLLARATLAEGLRAAVRSQGIAVAAEPVKETLKRVAGVRVLETPPRAGLARLQTPLIIRRDLLHPESLASLSPPRAAGLVALALELGTPVTVFDTGAINIALQSDDDWSVVRDLLTEREGATKERPS